MIKKMRVYISNPNLRQMAVVFITNIQLRLTCWIWNDEPDMMEKKIKEVLSNFYNSQK